MKTPKSLTGERIRERRLAMQLTQSELGETIGKSAAHISYLELGARVCNGELLATFADVLETSVDYLLGRDAPNTEAATVLSDTDEAIQAMMQDILVTWNDTDKRALLRYYEFLNYQQATAEVSR